MTLFFNNINTMSANRINIGYNISIKGDNKAKIQTELPEHTLYDVCDKLQPPATLNWINGWMEAILCISLFSIM